MNSVGIDSIRLYFKAVYKCDPYYIPSSDFMDKYTNNQALYYQEQYIIYHLGNRKAFYTIALDKDDGNNIPILIDDRNYLVKYSAQLIPIEDEHVLFYFLKYIDKQCNVYTNVFTSHSLSNNDITILSADTRAKVYRMMLLDKLKYTGI